MFLAIAVFFAVARQLFSGTILQHVLSVAKALTPPIGEATSKIIADLRVFLAMLILIYSLGLAKSIIQAINFLASEKLWGASAEVVKVVAAKRGIKLKTHGDLWNFVSKQSSRGLHGLQFNSSSSRHHFYHLS